jgi:hypothetical protein
MLVLGTEMEDGKRSQKLVIRPRSNGPALWQAGVLIRMKTALVRKKTVTVLAEGCPRSVTFPGHLPGLPWAEEGRLVSASVSPI